MLGGVLTWLCNNIDSFLPPREDAAGASPEHIRAQASHKAFSELGLVLRIAVEVPWIAARADFRRLVRDWIGMVTRQNVFFDIRRRTALLPYRVALYAAMKAFGAAPASVHAALQATLDRGFVCAIERSPASTLDLAYHLEAAGLTHALPDTAALIATSSLLSLAPLPYVRNIDLYSVTHMLFDLSDFCARDPRAQLGPAAAGLRAYLNLATAMCLAERNWDLAAELVMCRVALGDVSDALNHEATDAICEAQLASGCIPDAAWLDALASGTGPDSAPQREFDAVYHPTIVCLFMVACEGRAQ